MAATERSEGVPPIFGGKRLNVPMHYVYILKNREGRHYIGVSSNLEDRIKKHNCRGSRWTKYKGPWHLVHKEFFQNKTEALAREQKIKSYKGGNAFKKLMHKVAGPA